MKTVKHKLPVYLTGYLLNGDVGDLTDDEINEIDNFIKVNELGFCCDVSEQVNFARTNDLNRIGNDVADFTFFDNSVVKKNSYFTAQFTDIHSVTQYGVNVQFSNGNGNGKTNFLNLSAKEFEKVKAFLLQLESERP